MHFDHRRSYDDLKDDQTERGPGGAANSSSLAALADPGDDPDQVAEQQERDYPVRHLDVEWSAAQRCYPAPRKSLTRERRAGRVGGERSEDESQKGDSHRGSPRPKR